MKHRTPSRRAHSAAVRRADRVPNAKEHGQRQSRLRLRQSKGSQSQHRQRGQTSRGPTAPWHFWLVVIMATVYLGWRALEGVVWLVQWISGVLGTAAAIASL